MIFEILVPVVIVLAVFTVLYKLIPYRSVGEKKPFFAPLPKYQKIIDTKKSNEDIHSQLKEFGFSQVSASGNITKYKRGSVIGDFSIKLAKLNVSVVRVSDTSVKLTVEAGWFVAFDTGDFWMFLSELSQKIGNEE